jgi:fatty-acyl-CoA synthase
MPQAAKYPPKVRLKPMGRDELQAFLDLRAPFSARHVPSSPYTSADLWEERVAQHRDRTFLHYGDQSWTWRELDAWANRTAHALRDLGIGKGDVCALVMENRAPYLAVVLAAAKLGAITALVNASVSGKVLEHAIVATGAKAVIAGEERLAAFDGAELPNGTPIWMWPDPEKPADAAVKARAALDLSARVDAASDAAAPAAWRAGLVAEDVALYMFTSGTTGLPKAAKFSHMRWLIGGGVKQVMMRLTPDDVFYLCLPLYHGAAIMSVLPAAVQSGGAFVLRRKFSASGFWPDVRRYGVTVVQYVGEICRYLMSQPERPDDKDHPLRAMTGTSMNTELWHRFQERFDVPEIYEGFGSTESNTNVVNYENKAGSVGRIPYWEKTNMRLIRYDVESDTHPRDANGWMIPCQPGETGEVLGRINNSPLTGAGRFEGYTSAEATEKKTLRNVFEPGDAYWSSGDLMRLDEAGFLWFVDRIGDTFRWKSENVSTQEVADVLSDFPGVEMINVYGTVVPGQEGRAGMAALILQPGAGFDPKGFYDLTNDRLPSYARPLFVRIWREPIFTGSGKLRKVELQREAYNPSRFSDPLYVYDEPNGTYTPYSDAVLGRLGLPRSG